MLQRQHDGADHGDEQHEAGHLEEVDVARIEDEPELLRVGGFAAQLGHRRARVLGDADAEAAADEQQDQLGQHDAADDQADGRILDEAGAQLGEVDVEHHDDEQEQHGDGADVDDDEDHRQELGAEQDEQPGGVEEGEDEEEHGVHGVLGHDDHHRRGDRKRRKQIEEARRQSHRV